MVGLLAILVVVGLFAGYFRYLSFLRNGVKPQTVTTDLGVDDLRGIFVDRVCHSGWRIIDDGNPMVAQSSLATGTRQQIGLTLRRDDAGGVTATIEPLRLRVKVWTRVPTKGHTLRIRMNSFVRAVTSADPVADAPRSRPAAAPSVPAPRPAPPPVQRPVPVAATVAPPAPTSVATVPDGWYPDPMDPSKLRFWDRGAWTAHQTRRP